MCLTYPEDSVKWRLRHWENNKKKKDDDKDITETEREKSRQAHFPTGLEPTTSLFLRSQHTCRAPLTLQTRAHCLQLLMCTDTPRNGTRYVLQWTCIKDFPWVWQKDIGQFCWVTPCARHQRDTWSQSDRDVWNDAMSEARAWTTSAFEKKTNKKKHAWPSLHNSLPSHQLL